MQKLDSALAFILDINQGGKYLSEQTRSDIRAGKLKLVESTLIIRKEITGAANKLDVIDSNTKRLVGISDFEGQFITNPVVMFGISLSSQKIAQASFTSPAVIAYSQKITDFDKALLNGKIKISQTDIKLNQNVAALLNGGVPAGVRAEQYAPLSALQVLTNDENIDIELSFANGLTVEDASTNKSAVEVMIHCFELVKK